MSEYPGDQAFANAQPSRATTEHNPPWGVTLSEAMAELRVDRFEILRSERGHLVLTLYFRDDPKQPYGVREFTPGSITRTKLTRIEEALRDLRV